MTYIPRHPGTPPTLTRGSWKSGGPAPYPPMRVVVRAALVTVGEGKAVYAHHVLECGHTRLERVLVRPRQRCPCTECAKGRE